MNALMFLCPKTLREVDTGLVINLGKLRRVQPVTVRLLCPLCGNAHKWKLSDGLLDEPQAA